jgi:hypothetical protein
MNSDPLSFHQNLLQEVFIAATHSDSPLSRHDAFVDVISDLLVEAGEITNVEKCYKKARGLEISGYAVDESDDGLFLQLFIFLLDESESPGTISSRDVELALGRLKEFAQRSLNGFASQLDEVDEAYAAATIIKDSWAQFEYVKFVVVTNRRFVGKLEVAFEIKDKSIDVQVWDLERLFRLSSSGLKRESISIDLVERLGRPLPCLRGPEMTDHSVYLVVLPGQFLAEIYRDFGARLLERNVRAFLQTKGSVNKGIRATIVNEPERFMAYNNGISATASSVEVVRDGDGDLSMLAIEDLQIVNGGQTTASLAAALRKDRADLSKVAVQAKISVVDSSVIDELVPYISQFSNTQNKVTTADFFANDPFHVGVEGFSRTIWAPSVDGVRAQTRWFYERARGQYADELSRSGTPSQQRKFKAIYPPSQKFTKTDLAKFEHSFLQMPHLVSLGAEKNFRHFAMNMAERPIACDENYFRQLIAKAILFKSVDRLVAGQDFGGYKINIVAYTISKLSYDTQLMIDLDGIWQKQQISPSLESAIVGLSHLVAAEILKPRGRSRHVGEWTKKIDCWTVVREIEWTVPASLTLELRQTRGELIRSSSDAGGVVLANSDEEEAIAFCLQYSSSTWMKLASWGKETKLLAPYQNGIAYGIGKAIADPNKGQPSPKQAVQGLKMMTAALDKGFNPN